MGSETVHPFLSCFIVLGREREGEKNNFLLGIPAAWRQYTLATINSAK